MFEFVPALQNHGLGQQICSLASLTRKLLKQKL
jgi:hypothetical protein